MQPRKGGGGEVHAIGSQHARWYLHCKQTHRTRLENAAANSESLDVKESEGATTERNTEVISDISIEGQGFQGCLPAVQKPHTCLSSLGSEARASSRYTFKKPENSL